MADDEEELPGEAVAIERAFGVANRRRILANYFSSSSPVTPENAWQHAYRLLLWVNPTISLAHCSSRTNVNPIRPGTQDHWPSISGCPLSLAFPVLTSGRHLAPYSADSMPLPGDDPDLVELIADTLGVEAVAEESGRRLVERVYTHFARENKRKNLLGCGFEDTLAGVIRQLPRGGGWSLDTRVRLADIPGFMPQSEQLKRSEVDLALWQAAPGDRRIIVSAKWSVRADRRAAVR